ncbi:hypothetical protein BGZ54_008524 [Gamsiella multidivaricata]|nr:hypothetical protein BGZ54_008524 [Gamsiella multidivaricata]
MRNVPSSILIQYSHLFRIISNTGPFKGPFHCQNLIELSTVYGQEWSRELLITNLGLKRLVWGGPYYRRIETLEQQQEWQLELKALMGLENLDVLKTSGFSLGEGLFVKVLRNNASRLSNLALSTVEGVTSIEGLELPFLTELHITFGGTESPALVDLVRCCPRLQRLSLTGSRTRSPAPSPIPGANHHHVNNSNLGNIITSLLGNNDHRSKEFQIGRLAQNIRECCPELSAIKFSSNYTSVIQSQCFLHDFESAALVNACRRLEAFSADMVTLDHGLTEALVSQRHSLKSLTFSFHESSESDQQTGIDMIREVHCVRRLKASLVRLRELNLSWDKDLVHAAIEPSTSSPEGYHHHHHHHQQASNIQDEVAAFLEEPWVSLDMDTLSISGMIASAVSSSNDTMAHVSMNPSSSLSTKIGWRLVRPSTDSLDAFQHQRQLPGSNSRVSSGHGDGEVMQNLLLLNITPLTQLRNLTLNHAAYERIPSEEEVAFATVSVA